MKGQKMIQTLARKRTNAVGLAVVAALVAAMFVALQSVSAAPCAADPDITLGFGGTCEIDVTKIHEDADGAAIVNPTVDGSTVTVVASAVVTTGELVITAGTVTGTATVNITAPDDTNEPADDGTDVDIVGSFEVTVAGFAIVKTEIVDDPDGIVKAGAPIMVRATTRSHGTGAEVRLTVPSTGLSIAATVGTDAISSQSLVAGDTADNGVFDFTVNTAGAPDGVYTLTFTADDNGFATDNADGQAKDQTATLKVTVGDAGTGIASATLSLGNEVNDLPYTADDETKPETGTVAADGGDVDLVVQVFNSIGEKASTASINQITIIAPGGTISSTHATGEETNTAGGENSATLDEDDADDTADTEPGDVGQRTVVTISKTGGKPGTVSVYALVIGPGGAATTETVDLTFTGPADAIEVHDGTEALKSVNDETDDEGDTVNDTIKLQVTATDSGGLNATPPTNGVSVVITDADGKRVARNKMSATMPEGPAGDGKFYITITGMGSDTSPLAAGEYTVTAKRGDLEDEGTFVVAGAPANVDVVASSMTSDTIGDVITVTATVTDEDGNNVPNGTSIMFDHSEDTGLAPIGTGHSGKGSKSGSATVKYAVVGAGTTVISATAGGATGVAVVISTAGQTGADVAQEVGLDCLSSLTGFSSYTCSMGSTAAELFGMLSGRGATAIHLWNGSMWVRYAVVDGAEIPGSSDFTVTEDDILYISN